MKSTAARIAGNFPGFDYLDKFELISFFGQVPVKVKGVVNAGDFIIPSGKNDGTGIAVSESNLSLTELGLIVGRAWEASDKKGVKLINTAVGFNFSLPSLAKELSMLNDIDSQLENLKNQRQNILSEYDAKFKQQDEEIKKLIQQIQDMSSN